MGQPKAWLRIGDEPILSRLHRTLKWPGQTMLVTVPGRERPPAFELFDREVVDALEEGPLRGVFTALVHATSELVIVMPVDMIQFSKAHLKWLAEELLDHHLGLMMSRRDSLEPLPLITRRAVASQIEGRLSQGNRSLRGLAESGMFDVVRSPPEWRDEVWTNLNEPDDLRRL